MSEPVQMGAFYNSAAAGESVVPRLGRGWGLDFTDDVRVVSNADFSATYRGPGGLVGVYTRTSGTATVYTSPPGFKSDLVKTSTGWTLTDRQSKVKRSFTAAGKLSKVEDRNANPTTVTAAAPTGGTSYDDLTVVASAGTTDARTARVQTDAVDTEMWQQGSDWYRGVTFARSGTNMAKFTDAMGRDTVFSYTGTGLVSTIAAPGGVETRFSYDASFRVASVTQVESIGGPGDAVTRLTYPSATQTLLAGPNTNQAQAVAAVPHTTYTLNASKRVSGVVDAAGRTRSATYTANFDTLSAGVGSGTTSTTTTNTYGANSGDSLTKSASQTGAASSLAYANASPNQYQPSSSTNDAGNASTYTYNGAGNALTATSAVAAQAKVTRNSDGTAATATSPNNGTNTTSYAYTNHQLTTVTPVTGASLSSSYTNYDVTGRVQVTQNGNGVVTHTSYDDLDRVTSVEVDGTTDMTVSYTYDVAGNVATRTDPNGTTTYSYDPLYRLTFKENSTFGGEMNYVYDKASNLQAVTTDAAGSVYYDYDESGVPTKIDYPDGTGRAYLTIATDTNGRRTAVKLNSDSGTAWKARNQTEYDRSGRVTRVTADTGTGDSSYTRVVDVSYCYVKSTTAPTCTASTTNDRAKLQWKRDNNTGAVTTYTYDTSARLTGAVITGTGAKTFAYTYNSNGNRLSAAATGATTQTLTYNLANQISTTGYSYDGTGNMLTQPGTGAMTYTAADQLNTVTKSGTTYTYTYAGLGNDELLAQTTPSGTYKYAYGRTDPQGQPIIETIGKDTATASITSDPVTGQPLLLRSSSGRQALYIYDGTPGSPIALLTTTSSQAFSYAYDPFGVPTITTSSDATAIAQNPYLFADGLQDRTTGWIKYGARYYDPKTGSFTQQDALDAPLDPGNGNRYAYAGGDPINNIDPTGEKSLRGCAKAGLVGL